MRLSNIVDRLNETTPLLIIYFGDYTFFYTQPHPILVLFMIYLFILSMLPVLLSRIMIIMYSNKACPSSSSLHGLSSVRKFLHNGDVTGCR